MRRGLHDLVEQVVDLRGDRGAGVVALLGEVGVAASATRDRVHEQLVVAEPGSRSWRR